MKALAILLCLAACMPSPPHVPAELRTCEPPPPVPLPPTKPRTPDGIAAWGNQTELALRLANRRLAACDARRAAALQIIEAQP